VPGGRKQQEGREKITGLALSPLSVLFLRGFAYIVPEEFFNESI
jgi:hypothetical protein